MATEYVKILVRRGLREQLTSDILDTGEFGFTTDTNQLFIGIDDAINEIQFDPFINAHAIIQSWLDSDDCPFLGLTVDEDLVIRNIPTTYDEDGTPISGVQAVLDSMHFFTQEIDLVGDFNVDPGDTIYQRKFIFSDDEADIDNLVAEKTYKILSVAPNSQDFFNDAAGTIAREYSKHDTFTVREDYSVVPNLHSHEGSRIVEIVDITEVTHGVVSYAEAYDVDTDKKNIIVRVREGRGEFIQDVPYVNNYYHFNGNDNGNLKSDFGLFRWTETFDAENTVMRVWRTDVDDNTSWETVPFSILTDNPGTGNVEALTNDFAYPADAYGEDYGYAVVTSGPTVEFYQKLGGIWNLLAGRNILTGEMNKSDVEPTNQELGDYWVTMEYQDEWVKQDVTIVDEANYPDDIEEAIYNGIVIDKPTVGLMSNTNVNDHVVVTKSSKVTYWVRDEELADWKLIGSEKYETGPVNLEINTPVHTIDPNVLQAHIDKPGGYWKVIVTENVADNPTVTDLTRGTEYELWLDDPSLENNEIRIPGIDGDAPEDSVEIRYYYEDNFQFSDEPPQEYTSENYGETYTPPTARSNGDDLVVGDYYVYTDKDIFGGTNLNIFKWSPTDYMYQHDTVPVFYSDQEATDNASDGVLLYALPYEFEGEFEDSSVAILELRKRDYNTSTFWYPYDYSEVLAYHFTLNPIPNVAEPDITYAWNIEGKSEFAVGYLGRSRRNVEVITENSFNQLYADQHLSAQDSASGLRPSLFRKIFTEEDGVFLKFHKMISTTFFVDYSIKQVTPTKTFLRVGTLKIINGYPHDMPEIKLTDENTEIWHDNLESGNDDTLEDYDEFSNIVFETAVGEDQYGNETNDMLIIYRQDPSCTTEVSYTLKRWTM
jgi:hypothetical protein